jgi:hypothetical protein
MGIFANLGQSLFGKAKNSPAPEDDEPSKLTQTDVVGLSGSALENISPNQFQYHFNPRPLQRNPGPAYISPLLQFQEYPRNVVEGWGGIAYKRGFQSFEPMTVHQVNTPVPSGTSGIIHDQIYYQPLADTHGNTTAG